MMMMIIMKYSEVVVKWSLISQIIFWSPMTPEEHRIFKYLRKEMVSFPFRSCITATIDLFVHHHHKYLWFEGVCVIIELYLVSGLACSRLESRYVCYQLPITCWMNLPINVSKNKLFLYIFTYRYYVKHFCQGNNFHDMQISTYLLIFPLSWIY